MTVSVHGGSCVTGQIEELRKGFAALGHTHVDDWTKADFLFVGNPPYDQYLTAPSQVKTIFGFLDICWHCKEVQDIVEMYKKVLPTAHKVTCISDTMKHSIKEACDIEAETIYYPMRPVTHTGVKKYPFRAMMAGRLRDKNKYTAIAVQAMVRAGFKENEVAMCGPEYPGWGVDMGSVTDDVLNDLYNSVDYVMCCTASTGLELTPIEGCCVGAIPIVLPHLETFTEFWAGSPLGAHYRLLTSVNRVAELIRAIEANPTWKAEIKQDMLGYGALAFRPKMDAKAVAQRIVEVYESI